MRIHVPQNNKCIYIPSREYELIFSITSKFRFCQEKKTFICPDIEIDMIICDVIQMIDM
jgi:hypothetical protein